MIPLALTLRCFPLAGGCKPVSVHFGLLTEMSLSLAAFTAFLEVRSHLFVPEVQASSVFPCLTHNSTLSISAAACLQHEPRLKVNNKIICSYI